MSKIKQSWSAAKAGFTGVFIFLKIAAFIAIISFAFYLMNMASTVAFFSGIGIIVFTVIFTIKSLLNKSK